MVNGVENIQKTTLDDYNYDDNEENEDEKSELENKNADPNIEDSYSLENEEDVETDKLKDIKSMKLQRNDLNKKLKTKKNKKN